jgi:hypothetical protein
LRAHAGARTANLITAARGPKVAAIANGAFHLVEVGIFNTTVTAFAVSLQRATAVGTGGTALTEVAADPYDAQTIKATGINVPTADDTVTAGEFARATIGAANGAGIIWTFGKNGIFVPAGTSNAIGLYLPVGTAQHFDFYFVWEE